MFVPPVANAVVVVMAVGPDMTVFLELDKAVESTSGSDMSVAVAFSSGSGLVGVGPGMFAMALASAVVPLSGVLVVL